LIVDDEPLNPDLLDQELAEMGHVTERAIDGSEALAKLDTAIHHLPVRVIGGQPINKIEELSYHEVINTYRRELTLAPLLPPKQSRGSRQSPWRRQNSSAENHESPSNQLTSKSNISQALSCASSPLRPRSADALRLCAR
jgi:hypothetical protein